MWDAIGWGGARGRPGPVAVRVRGGGRGRVLRCGGEVAERRRRGGGEAAEIQRRWRLSLQRPRLLVRPWLMQARPVILRNLHGPLPRRCCHYPRRRHRRRRCLLCSLATAATVASAAIVAVRFRGSNPTLLPPAVGGGVPRCKGDAVAAAPGGGRRWKRKGLVLGGPGAGDAGHGELPSCWNGARGAPRAFGCSREADGAPSSGRLEGIFSQRRRPALSRVSERRCVASRRSMAASNSW